MKKIFLFLFGLTLFTVFGELNITAKADTTNINPTVNAKISFVDNSVFTGHTETKILTHQELPSLSAFSSIATTEARKYETTIEVDYLLDDTNQNIISPLSTNTGSANNGIAKSSITLTYWLSGNTIKVEKCAGSWSKASSSSIIVSDRYVTYKGPNVQQTAWKYPTSNSFSYNTGWGYASQNTAGNGRAYMSAYTSISGMGRLLLEAALYL